MSAKCRGPALNAEGYASEGDPALHLDAERRHRRHGEAAPSPGHGQRHPGPQLGVELLPRGEGVVPTSVAPERVDGAPERRGGEAVPRLGHARERLPGAPRRVEALRGEGEEAFVKAAQSVESVNREDHAQILHQLLGKRHARLCHVHQRMPVAIFPQDLSNVDRGARILARADQSFLFHTGSSEQPDDGGAELLGDRPPVEGLVNAPHSAL
mmetsp:Transcript_65780/g.192434  ORF Transcript_65780/g.192434 Transcript_65780/m.192434 type:complete len:212 (+) Transcript_65780:115-750(+)